MIIELLKKKKSSYELIILHVLLFLKVEKHILG